MASLQDQLLKAGLSNKNQAKKINKDKSKQVKSARKTKQQTTDQSKQAVKQAQIAQAERDRVLNAQKQQLAQEKAIAAQVIQLIQTNKLDRQQGEVPFSFVDQKVIKKIYVTEEIQRQLGQGFLTIVKQQNRNDEVYEVVPTIVAKKIAERDPLCIIEINKEDKNVTDEDDPYAGFEIPDDIMW